MSKSIGERRVVDGRDRGGRGGGSGKRDELGIGLEIERGRELGVSTFY